MNDRLRIIVLGYVVRGPLGGMVTSNLQYLLGLSRLGHDVYFVEDSDDFESCYNPVTMEMGADPTYGLEFAGRALERIGLGDHWAYWDAHTARWLGPSADDILQVCAKADVVLNLCGVNPLRPWLRDVPARAFVDEDPAFTQIKHLTNPAARELALHHTAFLSFGENIHTNRSAIPNDGLPWQPTRQPVVMDAWPVTPAPKHGKFRTVMQWDSYPAVKFHGRRYGLKCDSLGPYMDIPQRAGNILELAIARLPSETGRLLQAKGWSLCDPGEPSRDPQAYQHFLQQSKAEFSVAKAGYVVSRSGWFSERSACYLASGRPVIVQETGFSEWLPTGAGVLSFNHPDEAVAAIEEVNNRYEFHCRAARAVAEEFFDARKVIPMMLERALAPIL